MGSGGSKNTAKSSAPVQPKIEGDLSGQSHNRERRRSHVETNPPAQSDVLVPCGTCDRKFAADRIQKHAEARDRSCI